ncbi:Acyl-CoA-binding domain-containing protein 6 [Liparis tanakae]|uniref:Acyl-CoA-binding domain-containing protein 6 n=1 Tax=Liparis tanakae TaxID=230148 RepID=A0A4Z2JI12_9TELE|nr:Acyl-CoA-binding domain-containing protein 6 [Liparis tanakae]
MKVTKNKEVCERICCWKGKASACEFADIVELLLNAGADPSIKDLEGSLPEEVTESSAISSLLQSQNIPVLEGDRKNSKASSSATQNWEWSISSSHEAGLVGKSGYPVLLPVERSEVGPPAMALRAWPTPPGPPCTTRLSMLKPRLLRRGVWPGNDVMEEGD